MENNKIVDNMMLNYNGLTVTSNSFTSVSNHVLSNSGGYAFNDSKINSKLSEASI